MAEKFQMLIDGKWRDSVSDESMEVINPATSEIIAYVPKANAIDAVSALEAAHRAFKEWSSLPPVKRAAYLRKAIPLIQERKEDLSRWLTMEQGKPLKEARGEIDAAVEALEYFAEEAYRLVGETIPTGFPNRKSLIFRQPIGVVVAIVPWNYPVLLLSWKLAPALVAGCTVVAKPPSCTPLSITRFINCLVDTGIPPGVVNLVIGRGKELGETLITHPYCQKVALTGQTETGKEIMRLAAQGIKRITLELGGNCPLIVCEDAALDLAVQGGVYRSFRNMGQICNAINRIYVHESVYLEFVDRFVEKTSSLKIGNGLLDPDVDLGPMTTQEGRQKTRDHIQDAVVKGANILYGGKEPEGEEYRQGFFFEPTVLVNVTHQMRVMREETFGPVAPIMSFRNLDEAIAYANDSPYGLVAYVYTNSLSNTLIAAEHLEFGTVGINNVVGGEVPFPYAGWKESGLGAELSHYGIEEYLAIKHVRIDIGSKK